MILLIKYFLSILYHLEGILIVIFDYKKTRIFCILINKIFIYLQCENLCSPCPWRTWSLGAPLAFETAKSGWPEQ